MAESGPNQSSARLIAPNPIVSAFDTSEAMFRALVILCILFHGWLAAAGGSLAASCGGVTCERQTSAGDVRDDRCCPCCAVETVSCCCNGSGEPAPQQTPTPSRTSEILEQLGRLAATPLLIPAVTLAEWGVLAAPAEYGALAAPSAHLARVIATTHLLV
jgi:hypothetical protein